MKNQKQYNEDNSTYSDFDNKHNRKINKHKKMDKRKKRHYNEDLKYNKWN